MGITDKISRPQHAGRLERRVRPKAQKTKVTAQATDYENNSCLRLLHKG